MLTDEQIDKHFSAYLRLKMSEACLKEGSLSYRSGIPLYRLKTLLRGKLFIGVRKSELEKIAPHLGVDVATLTKQASGEYVAELQQEQIRQGERREQVRREQEHMRARTLPPI